MRASKDQPYSLFYLIYAKKMGSGSTATTRIHVRNKRNAQDLRGVNFTFSDL